MRVAKDKPHIKLNTHKHAPYKYRCVMGRYNGYADTIIKAYTACLKSFARSKYWGNDVKRNRKLMEVYQRAQQQGLI